MTSLAVVLWVIFTQDLGGWVWAVGLGVTVDLLYLGAKFGRGV